LDGQSMVNVFSNEKMLTNVRDAKCNLKLFCNAGKTLIKKKHEQYMHTNIWWYNHVSGRRRNAGNTTIYE